MTSVRRITLWGMCCNVVLTSLKLIIGYLAQSHSCIADAVHSLSDMLTDVIVLIGERFWSAPADMDHPHGHQRIEAMITALIGLLLAVSAISLGVNSVMLIADDEKLAVPGWSVFIVAVISIISKEILYQWTVAVGHATKSTAVIANAWHHRSDAMSSIPVALVALAGRIWPTLTFLDPVAAIIVSCMLLRTAWTIVWPCLKELSDQGVEHAQLDHIQQIASSVVGIKNVHKIRTRRLGNGILIDMHVLVDKNMTVEDGHRLCEQAAATIQKKMPMVLEVMTHMEPENSVDIEQKIIDIAKKVHGVKEVHSVRVRNTISGYDADLHVLVDPDMTVANGHNICSQVHKALLDSNLNIVAVLTHLEPFENN